MSQIINESGFVEDTFSNLVPLGLADYSGSGALELAPEDDPNAVAAHFETLQFITIRFGTSADGRGFSIAKALRALGYQGHLRASGHILVDQFRAARRCGFDDVEISATQAERNPEHQWQAVPLGAGYQSLVLS